MSMRAWIHKQLESLGIVDVDGDFRDWRPLVGPVSVVCIAGVTFTLFRSTISGSVVQAVSTGVVLLTSAYTRMLKSKCVDYPSPDAKMRRCFECRRPVTDARRTKHCWEWCAQQDVSLVNMPPWADI